MPANNLVVTIDATTAQFDRAMSTAAKATLRYEASLQSATKAQANFDRAVAASGASSAEAAAAQTRLDAALARTAIAQDRVAIATKRASEIQAAASAKSAAAAEAAAAKQAAATQKLGTVAGAIGAGAALALGLAAKAAADFNSKMAQVASLSGASAKQLDALSSAASGFADLGISASQAADAEIELTKAGLSAQQIIGGGLNAALLLAADGQMSVADATSIAASAMVQFKLPASGAADVADTLAAGADKALGSVQDLGEGLTYAGLGAHQAGLSLHETVGALAEFANAGLIGAQGGTTLQQVLRQLLGPTAKASDEIKALGLNLYDSQGHFVGLASVAGQLQAKLGPLSEAQRNAALNTLFTSRAVRGATILYQDGAAGVDKWTNAVDDSGFAAQQAHGKMDSLQGDMQKLEASFTNAAITVGQDLQPALRTVTQDLTTFVGLIGKVPAPVTKVAVEMAAVVAALGLGTFAFTRIKAAAASFGSTLGLVAAEEGAVGEASLLMSAKASLAANKMQLMRGAGIGLALALNEIHTSSDAGNGLLDVAKGAALGTAVLPGYGTAIGAVAGAFYGLATNSGNASVSIDSVTNSLNQTTGAVTASAQAAATSLASKFVPLLDKAGISIDTYSKALLGNKQAMGAVLIGADRLGAGVKDLLIKPMDDAAQKADALRTSLAQQAHASALAYQASHPFAESLAQASKESAQLGETMGKSASATKDNADATNKDAAAARSDTAAQSALNSVLVGRLNSIAALTLQIDSARAASKGLTNATKDNGRALNLLSHDGATLAQTLTGIASTAAQVTGSTKIQNAALDRARSAIESIGHAAGLSSGASQTLADKLLRQAQAAQQVTHTPATTRVSAPGLDSALAKMYALKHAEDALYSKSISITTVERTIHSGGSIIGNARGDIVRGPGTGTSDSIVRRVSNGEAITRAAIVQREGEDKFRALNAGQATIVPLVGFANGGISRYEGMNRAQSMGGYSHQTIVQAPSGPLTVEGKLSIDKDGVAWLRGIAKEVVMGDAVDRGARQRAGRRAS